jgi:HD domain
MTNHTTQLDTDRLDLLRERCRMLDMPTIRCSLDGEILTNRLAGEESQPGALDALCKSTVFCNRLGELATQWNEMDLPEPGLIVDGLTVIPLVEHERRHRRTAYLVAFARGVERLDEQNLNKLATSAGVSVDAIERSLETIAHHEPQSLRSVAGMLQWMHGDLAELTAKNVALGAFSSQLAESYEEINLLYKLGRFMTELAAPERYVEQTCSELHATMSYHWVGAVFVSDHQLGRQMAGRFVLHSDESSSKMAARDAMRFALDHASSSGPFVVRIDDYKAATGQTLNSDLIACAITRSGTVIGVCVAGDKMNADSPIDSADLKLVDAAAGSTGVYLENAYLYDEQQAMFMGTLEALSAAIDAKDRYTCGHSERVANLAVRLAQSAGIEDEHVERIRICGLVHDIGKIGVPEAVLCKTGKLTNEEYDIVKLHPEIGVRILRDIPQLADVLPGVLHHHERWDGKGYPYGLAGEDIPLYARLLALADSFDAMSSTRTYRAAMPRCTVMEEIRNGAGAQFDAEFAKIFVEMDFTEYDRQVQHHHRSDPSLERSSGEAA